MSGGLLNLFVLPKWKALLDEVRRKHPGEWESAGRPFLRSPYTFLQLDRSFSAAYRNFNKWQWAPPDWLMNDPELGGVLRALRRVTFMYLGFWASAMMVSMIVLAT